LRTVFILIAVLLASCALSAQEVRIGVLSLFHPHELTVQPAAGTAIVLHGDQHAITLESNSSIGQVDIRAASSSVVVRLPGRSLRLPKVVFTSRKNESADFVLAIPGRISRHYHGKLELEVVSGLLVPIVTMDLETAVASVVAAEGLPGSPIEALKAQAVAARSYFVTGRERHKMFDFCDTTHCQFLREPPAIGTAAFNASAETRGLVIAYNAKTFAAMYTRSCGGHTRTPADVGMASGEYPYYSVECKYCRDHPARWRSQITATDAVSLRSSNESARLAVDRRLGWGAVQSDDFAMTRRGTQLVVEGVGQGHGIGLCQAGAVGMANERFNFRQILAHYYPNTKIVSVNRR